MWRRRRAGDDGLGRWDPLPLDDVADLFAAAPFRWWISGGRALDLFVGRTWRRHADLDVGMCRTDVPGLGSLLAGWDLRIAAAGGLSPWDGSEPSADRNENNIWCRRAGDPAWRFDVTISTGDDTHWVFRRDPTLRVPWDEAVWHTPSGLPYLAPHLQLLFKMREPRPKDTLDAVAVIPHLTPDQAATLAARAPDGHPWEQLLR